MVRSYFFVAGTLLALSSLASYGQVGETAAVFGDTLICMADETKVSSESGDVIRLSRAQAHLLEYGYRISSSFNNRAILIVPQETVDLLVNILIGSGVGAGVVSIAGILYIIYLQGKLARHQNQPANRVIFQTKAH